MHKEQEETKKNIRALSRKRFPKQLQNGTGDMVDIDMVREDHLRKHDVVEKVFARIEKLEAQLAKEHEKMLKELDKYYDYVEAETGFRPYNESGHTISNYSKTKQIMLHRRPVIEFDDGILIAKQMIDKCFNKWGAGADKRLFLLFRGLSKLIQKVCCGKI